MCSVNCQSGTGNVYRSRLAMRERWGGEKKSDGRGVVSKVAERFFLSMKSGYEPNHGKCGCDVESRPQADFVTAAALEAPI